MVLKLFGAYPSYNALRVALILHEKIVPFEFVSVDMPKGEHKSPAYLEKQPFGQVPYIVEFPHILCDTILSDISDQDDDGFILYESRAIGHYIATKYADQGTPGLIPTEIKAYGLFQQACSVEEWNFQVYAGKATFELFVKPFLGLEPDRAAFDGYIASISKNLDVYEQILSKQKYLGGDVRMGAFSTYDCDANGSLCRV